MCMHAHVMRGSLHELVSIFTDIVHFYACSASVKCKCMRQRMHDEPLQTGGVSDWDGRRNEDSIRNDNPRDKNQRMRNKNA